MRCSAQKNRQAAQNRIGDNLEVLLQERYKFLGNYIKQGECILEVGAGIGVTSNYLPETKFIQTDIEVNQWIDVTASADALPFSDEQFDSVICIAVLHHLNYPVKALHEMARVVKAGGNILILEVNDSWLLRLLLFLTKHEYIDTSVDPFGPEPCQTRSDSNWDGNNAVGDLLFSDKERLESEIPELEMVHHRFIETFIFLNSGGVNYRAPYIPLPKFILNMMVSLDNFLCRVAPGVFAICREIIMKKI